MNQLVDEAYSFRLLQTALRQDLVSCHGFSNPDAGAILNWFCPSNSEYLVHVDQWQKWLCSCVTDEAALPYSLIRKNVYGYYDLLCSLPIHQIGAIHQVAKLFYKWHGVPRKETNMDEVKDRLHRALPMTLDEFEIAGIRAELSALRPPDLNSVIGRFGPGATYEGFDAYQKWKRLGRVPDVPFGMFRPSPRDTTQFSILADGTTKIAEVPKSIKCNRIVSSEPAMYMFCQLAVNDALVAQLHRLFPQHISLDNQERHNQALMWDGACSIDLSDASDHVSVELVKAVLPQFWPVLARVRSTFSLFPDGDLVELSTFAPMGSGVCFSIMTTVILGILRYASRVIRRETGRLTWFHVYGDDIIVPYWMYDYVNALLARAGLVVNLSKSCCTQVYRESCGRELLMSEDITPAYIRDPIDTVDAAKVEQIASRLEARAFPKTASTIADLAQAVRSVRYAKDLQRLEVNVRVTTARQKIRNLDGWDGLMRWYSTRTKLNRFDSEVPTGVSAEVWTKPGWRYRASQDYPYLSTWFVTRQKPKTRGCKPRQQSR
jgi:hypothetical protein